MSPLATVCIYLHLWTNFITLHIQTNYFLWYIDYGGSVD